MKFPRLPSIPAAFPAILCAAALTACDQPTAAPTPPVAPPAPTPIGEAGSVTPEPTVPTANSSLEGYKTSITEIKTFMESHQNEEDSVKALDRLRELVTRISVVKTDGLPDDLATAFNTVKTGMQRIQTAFDSLPVPVDQFEQWMADQAAKGGDAVKEAEARMETFVETMTTIQKDIEPAAKAMNEAGAKYGVPPLDLNGQ
ncbi:MAG: hypothetical protein V4726_05405 [Verrucomicrobiota bacterium]